MRPFLIPAPLAPLALTACGSDRTVVVDPQATVEPPTSTHSTTRTCAPSIVC